MALDSRILGNRMRAVSYRIESDFPLASDGLPADVFTRHYSDRSAAIAMAIEGVDDPKKQEVRVVRVGTGEVVWRSTDASYATR